MKIFKDFIVENDDVDYLAGRHSELYHELTKDQSSTNRINHKHYIKLLHKSGQLSTDKIRSDIQHMKKELKN